MSNPAQLRLGFGGVPSTEDSSFAVAQAAGTASLCISGTVAVSAFELNTLPMPSPEQMKTLERMLRRGAARDIMDKTVAKIYEIERRAIFKSHKDRGNSLGPIGSLPAPGAGYAVSRGKGTAEEKGYPLAK